MRKFLIIAAIVGILLTMISCFDGPWTDILDDVPYRPQEQYNYCAIACIQMWSWYHGYTNVTQTDIADYIGIDTLGTYPESVVEGINHFTQSNGFLVEYNNTNLGQDYCIAACIAAIKDFTPAIMPFYCGTHAVLVIGFTWHYEDSIRIADTMYYHDPNPQHGANMDVTAIGLKIGRFSPIINTNKYLVIVGRQANLWDGLDGYNTFITEGGTFYGGPEVYNPLTFDPFEN